MTSFNIREIVQAAMLSSAAVMLLLSSSSSSSSTTTTQVLAFKEGGFQSGPSPGAMYAGGLKYDSDWDTIYMTGSHYNVDFTDHDGTANDLMVGTELDGASSCYVGMLDMNLIGPTTGETFHTLTNWRSYGDPGVMETCSAVTTDKNEHAFIVGSVAKKGFFHKVKKHPIVALTAVVKKNNLDFVNAGIASSENDNNNQNLLYPLAVIHSDTNDQVLYVAALTSVDRTSKPISGQPNWQENQMFGSSFYLSVLKWKIRNDNNNKEPLLLWIKDFPMDLESDGVTLPDVFIGGMLLQKDTNGFEHLIIAGSTRGTGTGYGEAEPDSDDEDGFIMQLSPKDGSFLFHKRHKGRKKKNNNKNNVGTNNIREGTGSDDLIRGICHAADSSLDEFYIVGGSKGDMTTNEQGEQNDLDEVNAGYQFGSGVEQKYSDLWDREESLQPFLRRVSFKKQLAPVWTTQWAAMPNDSTTGSDGGALTKTNAYAMDCVVDPVSKSVFVVGTVLNGAVMTQGDVEMISQGGDDIWVAKVDERTGNVHWITQLGNFGDESPARHKSIAINGSGNVIIYGDTTSNLYRARDGAETSDTSDMFIMVVDGESGAVNDNFYMGGTSSAAVSGSVNGVPLSPTGNDEYDGVEDNGDALGGGQPVPSLNDVMNDLDMVGIGPNSSQKDKSKTQSASNGKSNTGKVFAILFGIIAALCAMFFVFKQRQKTKSNESQKSSIFSCLQKFDVEDIDLRRSPPGGWHGTYMNKLAYGVNNAEDAYGKDGIIATDLDPASYRDDIDDDGAPLNSHSHSSIANDSLFVDSASSSKPSLDGRVGYKDNSFEIDEKDEVDIHLQGRDLI